MQMKPAYAVSSSIHQKKAGESFFTYECQISSLKVFEEEKKRMEYDIAPLNPPFILLQVGENHFPP